MPNSVVLDITPRKRFWIYLEYWNIHPIIYVNRCMILSESLDLAVSSPYRFDIEYRDRSVVRGYLSVIRGQYYITFNKRSLLCTRIDVDRIMRIRYSNSKVVVFKGLGRY